MDPVLISVLTASLCGLFYAIGWYKGRASKGPSIEEWQYRIDRWVESKLMPHKPEGMKWEGITDAFLRKFREECAEFVHEVRHGHGLYMAREATDVVVTMVACMWVHNQLVTNPGRFGGSERRVFFAELEQGLSHKLPILEQREWYYNDELGVFKGVKIDRE